LSDEILDFRVQLSPVVDVAENTVDTFTNKGGSSLNQHLVLVILAVFKLATVVRAWRKTRKMFIHSDFAQFVEVG
jgi:hypothetical protein